jgi:AcrR family transcriptional regulator
VAANNAHRAPLQARSRKTMAAVLGAVEELLRTRDFADIPVADIVARAGTSVGAFYARFRGKEALMPLLYQRYDGDVTARLDAIVADPQWGALDLRACARRLVAMIVDMYRSRRGLMRAVGLFARLHPEAISPALVARRKVMHRRFADLLLAHRREIRHPDPPAATEMALFAVGAACRDKILFAAPHARTLPDDDAMLRREMERLLLAYLTWKDDAR